MNNIVITGRPAVICGGEADTAFRDKNGNWHAQFFKASVGGQVGGTRRTKAGEIPQVEGVADAQPGEYIRARFRVSANDAEYLGNLGMGTLVRIEGRVRTRKNEAGVLVPVLFVHQDGTKTYDVDIEDIEVVKQGLETVHRTLYIADVGKKSAAESSTESKESELG
jgi:hypothetical protein